MNEQLQSDLRSKITSEFNQFLVYTIVPALFIILLVSVVLIWYAKRKISDRINQLTLMVDNPHQFKSDKDLREASIADVDEIEKLVRIFSKFYNEEKVKGSASSLKGRIDKKVSMLPMKSSINLYAQVVPQDSKEEAELTNVLESIRSQFERDLGVEDSEVEQIP